MADGLARDLHWTWGDGLMGRVQFRDWVSNIDELTAARCPGAGRSLRRHRCKSCGRTFGALIGTALFGLHRKERWHRLSPGRPARLRRRPVPSARRCGALHIQTATSHHSQSKGFPRRFRGIATKCLDSCPRRFHLVALGRHPSPRACLAAASARTCLRFTN